LASDRIAELACDPVGDDPNTFVDRGGLRRLETEAADAAIRRVREAAYPLPNRGAMDMISTATSLFQA
jgi:hypothetical protein